MNKEEKITISVNEEDVQNIINAYEKDIKYINQLEKENQRLKEIEKEHQRINGCLHLEIKELKDIIDKAVEYIEQLEENEWRCFGRKILTEILKGDKE